MKKKIFSVIYIAIGLIIGVSTLFVFADWAPPTHAPPNCPSGEPGCDALLNVGPSHQTKLGSVSINTTTITPDPYGLDVFGISRFFGNLEIGTLAVPATIKIVDGNQGDGKVLTSNANGVGTWKTPTVGSSGTVTVIQKFGTRYSTLMADPVFRTWVNNPTMPTSGGNDHGWYIRSADQKFTDTRNHLCTFFVENGRSYGNYTGGDYGSDNNNTAYYWNPAGPSWVAESHGDNGNIDITSLVCVGSSVYERGLPYLL